MAVGVFYKRDEFDYDADPAVSKILPEVPDVIGARPDIAGFATAPDGSGDESNADAYVELRIPLLKDRAGAQSVELRARLSLLGLFAGRRCEIRKRPN